MPTNILNSLDLKNINGIANYLLSGSIVKGYLKAEDGKFYEEDTYTTEIIGHKDVFYITLDTNLIYRYDEDAVIPVFIQIGGSLEADEIQYDNTTSGMTAINTQAAIDEVEGRVDTLENTNYVNSFNTRTGAVTLSSNDVTTALGYTPPQQDTTYNNATQSTDGLMSKEDKEKLDGVETNANNYSLPLAGNDTRGGIQIGYTASGKNYPVQLDNEKAYVNVPWEDTTYNDATQSTHGLMSTADKTKLDGVAIGANNYSLPLAASGTRGGIQLGYTTAVGSYAIKVNSEKAYAEVPVTNNTATTTAITASTNLATMNTLKNALNRATGIGSADTNYTTSMMRGIKFSTTDLTPGTTELTSGAICLVYEA